MNPSLYGQYAYRKRKPEMVDKATQTTPRTKEQIERDRREARQKKKAQYMLQQQMLAE